MVVAGVIRDSGGRILVTRRPEGRHMAGLWEFPGGKVHPHEHPEQALIRELREELGVDAAVVAPVTFGVHDERDRRIVLLFYEARITSGEPEALDGQEIRWVTPIELGGLSTPPADARLILMLQQERPAGSS
jgi:8-oxo-dGTP diphosphatase